MRDAADVARLAEVYPPDWRRWCDGPESGGCFCMGCFRVPAPSTVRGDPEYCNFPNPSDALTKDEALRYVGAMTANTNSTNGALTAG